jgi:hypothetical protein
MTITSVEKGRGGFCRLKPATLSREKSPLLPKSGRSRAPCVESVFREMGVGCEVDLLFDGDDLLDQRVFGEAFYRSLLVDAVDSAAVRVED